MRDIKVGIIGTGGIAHCHMDGYRKLPNVQVTALCDLDAKKAEAFAKEYGLTDAHIYTDAAEMCAKEDIESVSVCTWNAAHAPCTIAALNAGKNVLCEKPMAMNAQEAQAMQDAAEKNGKLLQVGFVRRFGHDAEIVQDFIGNGTIGDIYYAKATYLRRHGFPGKWFGDKSYSGGGPLIDLGVHVIDLSRYLMGNHLPVSVYGATFDKLGSRPELKTIGSVWSSTSEGEFNYDVEDLASAMIRFDNGAVLHIEASFDLQISEGSGYVQLFGTKGGAKLDNNVTISTECAGYMVDMEPYGTKGHMFDGFFDTEMRHFIECSIDRSITCRAPGVDGVILMKILDAVYESSRTGHEVVIKY